MINKDAFSHGQILSKLWLCDNLEQYLKSDMNMAVVGSWYNTVAFLLLTRNPVACKTITGIDIDIETVGYANQICNYWTFGENPRVINKVGNADTYDYSDYDVVVNCSVEHMSSKWFDRIKPGTLVCIQSSDVTDEYYPWLVTNANPDIQTFKNKYPLSHTMFLDTKNIQYGTWGYKRFMLIGIK